MYESEMKNSEKEKENVAKRIDWVNNSGYWANLIFGLIMFLIFFIIGYLNIPKDISFMFFYFSFVVLITFTFLKFTFIAAKRIVIDENILSIYLIGRTIIIHKSDIRKIEAHKRRGRLYHLRINNMLPIYIPWDKTACNKLDPRHLYDVVEEIKNWFKDDSYIKE